MKRFDEQKIVANLMGHAVGDLILDDRVGQQAWDRSVRCFLSLLGCRGTAEEYREPLAELRRAPDAGFAWFLTADGANFILANLQGWYSTAIEKRLQKIVDDAAIEANLERQRRANAA